MDAERAIARLEEYQRQISAVLDTAHPLLSEGEASQFKELALARWHLLRILREYQLFKHSQIFDPIIAKETGLKASVATLLKKRCIEVADAFNAHVQRWSLQGPSSAWPAYSAEAGAMSEKIRKHLVQELRDIRSLLTGMQGMRSPPLSC